MEHHAAQGWPELLQAALEILLVEELRILEACSQDRLVARSYLPAASCFRACHQTLRCA